MRQMARVADARFKVADVRWQMSGDRGMIADGGVKWGRWEGQGEVFTR